MLVERCRYLEQAGCASVCINSCKVPTQVRRRMIMMRTAVGAVRYFAQLESSEKAKKRLAAGGV